VRQFLRTYPPLSDDKLNVDFLPESAKSYSVEAVPAQEIIRSYVDGSSVRQCLFVVASREIYGEEVPQQLENLEFYQNLSDWLKEKTRKKELPNLGDSKQVLMIGATTSGYAFSADSNHARYQLQCRMEYLQRSE
jgi:hypothetical protein